jgi:CHASE2 domain-containing sensor protein
VSDRSDELRRQRDLLTEHLAWIEREIAREAAEAQQEAPVAQPPPRLAQPQFSVSASDADRDAEAILAEFRRSAPAVEAQTKRGCILYFAAAVGLLLVIVLGAAYFYYRAKH